MSVTVGGQRISRLLLLPQEILMLVVELLEDRLDQLNISLACRLLQQTTLPVLYHDVRLTVEDTAISQIAARALAGNAGGMASCKYLEIVSSQTSHGSDDSSIADIIELLPPHGLFSFKYADRRQQQPSSLHLILQGPCHQAIICRTP
jgi:hypothetical protein